MTNIDDVYMQSLREDRKNSIMNTEGPFYDAFQGSKDGVLRQELITYKIRDGMLVIERTMRHYNGDDYTDSSSTTPLAEVADETDNN